MYLNEKKYDNEILGCAQATFFEDALLKIIIVGSGIAGLAAANELAKQHYDVTILEADNRIGGRIWTDYSLGIPVDKGASWIHGIQNNPVADLVHASKLKTAFTELDKVLFFDEDKKIIPKEKLSHFVNHFFEELSSQAKKLAESAPNDISFLEAIKNVKPKNFDPKMENPWRWCLKRMSLITGGPVSLLSARHWDEEEILAGGNYLMLDGYGEIIKNLAESCQILLNQTVKKIHYTPSGVEITTEKEIFHCDKVIVTVSLGVLKNQLIEFQPILPDFKLKAIHNLNMGLLNKIILKFPTPFWPTDPVGIYLSGQGITHFMNYFAFWQQPILGAYVGGDEAEELEKLSDEAVVDMALTSLKKYFGNAIPDPDRFVVTRWKSNPFTLGSYSYIPVHASGADYDALAMPINNQLFFAGEATHRKHLATVHGAYMSGIREARRILSDKH